MHGWRVPEGLVKTDRPVIIYGEPLFAEAVCDQIGLVLLEPPVDWLTTVPRDYLSRDVEILTLGEARQIQSEAFVKPSQMGRSLTRGFTYQDLTFLPINTSTKTLPFCDQV